MDIEIARAGPGIVVQADAARLPFRDRVFELVICNHSIEHFAELSLALEEIGRVLKTNGGFFASIPDSSTLTDWIYRWLGRGGGHVNQISDIGAFISSAESKARLRHSGTRLLLTSLSFLNSHGSNAGIFKSLSDLGIDTESVLVPATWWMRRVDARLGTRTSVYGWAVYFGSFREPVDQQPWGNVCVRCGAAHPSEYLLAAGAVVEGWLVSRYACPGCGAVNLFTADSMVRHFR